jgi:hypothetical protein
VSESEFTLWKDRFLMQVEKSSNLNMAKARTAKWVDFRSRHETRFRFAAGYAAFSVLAYVAIATHMPLTLYPDAMHDDALFISLGQHLAHGKWLGPYNAVTLIKGPGYPAFLAAAQWLGTSVSLAHALFHCFSVTAFVLVLHRFMRSFLLSGLLFTLLLWHPVSLSVVLQRPIRDEIYYGQMLLILASLVALLFFPSNASRKILCSVTCGLLLGWFWLTREEGIWILPGIAVFVAVALWAALRRHRLRALLAPLTIVACIFAVTQIGYRAANWWAYGKFIGIEVKDKNFENALGAISSVRSGGTKPFISVTKAARERIYAVSPTFASLRDYFDGGQDLWSARLTCELLPDSCGEIAAGWFMWSLRETAAQKGHFSSATAAASFFKQIADEISAACARGQLECSPQLIPEMPQTSLSQIAERLPSRYVTAVKFLLLIDPPLQVNPSHGTEAQLAPVLRFLNFPLFNPSPDVVSKFKLSAWYYRKGHDWIVANVRNPDGTPAQTKMDRSSSPDLQSAFKDPDASEQRFILDTTCVDKCVLEIETPEGQKVEKTLGEIRAGKAADIAVGGGTVHIDSTDTSVGAFAPSRIDEFCNTLRIIILSHYSWLSIPTIIAGLLSFFIATLLYWRIVMLNICYVVALASWVLVFSRASLLILIDATSFPALNLTYLTPAHFLLMSGAVLSCAALLNLARPRVKFRKRVVQ